VAEHCGRLFEYYNDRPTPNIVYYGNNLHGQECTLKFRNHDTSMGRELCFESRQFTVYSPFTDVTVKIYEYPNTTSDMATKVNDLLICLDILPAMKKKVSVIFILS